MVVHAFESHYFGDRGSWTSEFEANLRSKVQANQNYIWTLCQKRKKIKKEKKMENIRLHRNLFKSIIVLL